MKYKVCVGILREITVEAITPDEIEDKVNELLKPGEIIQKYERINNGIAIHTPTLDGLNNILGKLKSIGWELMDLKENEKTEKYWNEHKEKTCICFMERSHWQRKQSLVCCNIDSLLDLYIDIVSVEEYDKILEYDNKTRKKLNK